MKVRNVSAGIRGYAKVGKSVALCAPGEVVEIPKEQEAKFLQRLTDAWAPVEPPNWPANTRKPKRSLDVSELPGNVKVAAAKAAAERTLGAK